MSYRTFVGAGLRPAPVLLTLILITYLIVGGLFAIRTPDWQNPDEPAHYNYIRQVAANGCCPLIEMGDWDSPYLDELKAARFAPEFLTELDTVQYEDHQPPVYYLLLAPVYQLTGGSLTALRIASLLFGLVIIIAAFGIGITLFPDRPEIGLGTAAFVAFQPQHLAILASLNNDALGWALVAVMLWASVVYVKVDNAPVKPWHLGILLGIAFATKATAYPMAAIIGLALLLRTFYPASGLTFSTPSIRAFLVAVVQLIVPALLIGLLWWLRNFSVYGFPDFLGLRAHDTVVVGQLRTNDYIAQLGSFGAYLSEALKITFYSFWGMFGWQALPLVGDTVGWIYPLIGGVLLVGLTGWLLDIFYLHRQEHNPSQRNAWLLIVVLVLLSVLAYLYYNTAFVQFQGRYMFTLLIPLGLCLTLGLDAWRRLILGKWAGSRWLVPLLFFAFAGLDVWLLWRVIVPNLTPTV